MGETIKPGKQHLRAERSAGPQQTTCDLVCKGPRSMDLGHRIKLEEPTTCSLERTGSRLTAQRTENYNSF